MSDLKALETIYEEVIKRFQFESERTKHLDDKASNIIGFVGIMTGVVSGLGAYVLKTTNFIATTLFFVALMLLIFSFILGLAAYRTMKFTLVPDAYFLIGFYEKKEKERILRDLGDNYAIATEKNMMLNDKKAIYIKRAMYVLFIAILLISFFVLFATIM